MIGAYKILQNKGFLWLSLNPCFESVAVAAMAWSADTEYWCHKIPQKCSMCLDHNTVFSSFINYHRVCKHTNTTGGISGVGFSSVQSLV